MVLKIISLKDINDLRESFERIISEEKKNSKFVFLTLSEGLIYLKSVEDLWNINEELARIIIGNDDKKSFFDPHSKR
jgi:Ni,Fe-hydrogenase III component G